MTQNKKDEARGKSFRVVSIHANPKNARAIADFDYCGSISQALRRINERWLTEQYRKCYAERLRLTKGRTTPRRWLLASNPVGTITKPR